MCAVFVGVLLASAFFMVILSYGLTTYVMMQERKVGFVGKDMNKPGDIQLPKSGGLGVVVGLVVIGLGCAALFYITHQSWNGLAMMCFSSLVLGLGFIGLWDDVFILRQDIKMLLPIAIALTVLPIDINNHVLFIPFLGSMDVGILYPLFIVPIGITAASNLTNMFAGFNGLEAGLGLIVFIFLGIIAWVKASTIALLICLLMASGLATFLWFNKYPAQCFPGDVLTLVIGGVITYVLVLLHAEVLGAGFLALPIIDFFIKLRYRFPSKTFGTYDKRRACLVCDEAQGLIQLIIKWMDGVGEQKLVSIILGAQFVVSMVITILILTI